MFLQNDNQNGLTPICHQASIWTNADLLSIGPLGININEMSMEKIAFKKIHLKLFSAKCE